jgi:oligoribonuclease NrnB/cAMP/cGMP phosphodiesterase (DHH superfamily)
MNKAFHVFTHKDLDGAASLLAFLWSNPEASVTYREITNVEIDLIKDYVNKTCNPPQILIMDLSLRDEMYPDLDYDYITFIDHHKQSEKHIKNFKQAKVIHEEISSNALLVRNLYKNKAPEFTDSQKKLILYANDHDSGENRFKESYNLNILFWTQFRNEFCYFCNYYKNGFKPFSENQKKIIQQAKEKAAYIEQQTNCYGGNLVIDGEVKNVIAAMTESFNSIVIDMLISKYQPDILFYINTKTEKISMRQTKKSKNVIDLSSFAEKYCDGNGHVYAAGGKVTPLFMELTKKLRPI